MDPGKSASSDDGPPSKEDMKKADDHRLAGNRLFKEGKYAEAKTEYTKAIALNPNVSKYYTNRALCMKRLNMKVPVEDLKRALELDPNDSMAKKFYDEVPAAEKKAIAKKFYDEVPAAEKKAISQVAKIEPFLPAQPETTSFEGPNQAKEETIATTASARKQEKLVKKQASADEQTKEKVKAKSEEPKEEKVSIDPSAEKDEKLLSSEANRLSPAVNSDNESYVSAEDDSRETSPATKSETETKKKPVEEEAEKDKQTDNIGKIRNEKLKTPSPTLEKEIGKRSSPTRNSAPDGVYSDNEPYVSANEECDDDKITLNDPVFISSNNSYRSYHFGFSPTYGLVRFKPNVKEFNRNVWYHATLKKIDKNNDDDLSTTEITQEKNWHVEYQCVGKLDEEVDQSLFEKHWDWMKTLKSLEILISCSHLFSHHVRAIGIFGLFIIPIVKQNADVMAEAIKRDNPNLKTTFDSQKEKWSVEDLGRQVADSELGTSSFTVPKLTERKNFSNAAGGRTSSAKNVIWFPYFSIFGEHAARNVRDDLRSKAKSRDAQRFLMVRHPICLEHLRNKPLDTSVCGYAFNKKLGLVRLTTVCPDGSNDDIGVGRHFDGIADVPKMKGQHKTFFFKMERIIADITETTSLLPITRCLSTPINSRSRGQPVAQMLVDVLVLGRSAQHKWKQCDVGQPLPPNLHNIVLVYNAKTGWIRFRRNDYDKYKGKIVHCFVAPVFDEVEDPLISAYWEFYDFIHYVDSFDHSPHKIPAEEEYFYEEGDSEWESEKPGRHSPCSSKRTGRCSPDDIGDLKRHPAPVSQEMGSTPNNMYQGVAPAPTGRFGVPASGNTTPATSSTFKSGSYQQPSGGPPGRSEQPFPGDCAEVSATATSLSGVPPPPRYEQINGSTGRHADHDGDRTPPQPTSSSSSAFDSDIQCLEDVFDILPDKQFVGLGIVAALFNDEQRRYVVDCWKVDGQSRNEVGLLDMTLPVGECGGRLGDWIEFTAIRFKPGAEQTMEDGLNFVVVNSTVVPQNAHGMSLPFTLVTASNQLWMHVSVPFRELESDPDSKYLESAPQRREFIDKRIELDFSESLSLQSKKQCMAHAGLVQCWAELKFVGEKEEWLWIIVAVRGTREEVRKREEAQRSDVLTSIPLKEDSGKPNGADESDHLRELVKKGSYYGVGLPGGPPSLPPLPVYDRPVSVSTSAADCCVPSSTPTIPPNVSSATPTGAFDAASLTMSSSMTPTPVQTVPPYAEQRHYAASSVASFNPTYPPPGLSEAPTVSRMEFNALNAQVNQMQGDIARLLSERNNSSGSDFLLEEVFSRLGNNLPEDLYRRISAHLDRIRH